jgi:phenylacetate-CoA ligase
MATADSDSYMFQPEIEIMPRQELESLQLKRLQDMVARAYANVPHYRHALDAKGVKPDHIVSLDDLRRLPFTVKDDLRRAYPFGMFAVPREDLLRVHASSGTTGKPTVVGYTRQDLDTWAELMARSIACAGGRPGEVLHNSYGYGLFTGGLGAHDGATRLGCSVVPMSGGNTERQVMLLKDFGASVLCSTPSYALNIVEVAESEGVDLRSLPLHTGIFGAEPWSQAMRERLESAMGIRAVNIYGLSEIMGPGVAIESGPGRDGMHGWEDHFIFELIDPDTGERVADGEEGELVITTLTKQALPIMRYRTRDITRLNYAPCPATGRTHVRIMGITGRNDDMLIIRGVNVFPSQVESVLVGFPNIAPHYQLVVSRAGTMDNLTVEVEAAPGTPEGKFDEIAKGVTRHIKSMIGVTCRTTVMPPGEIPRSQGKAVRVRDLRE